MAVLPDNSVTTSMIQDYTITEKKLAPDCVTNLKIASNSISGEQIANNQIGTGHIKLNAVTEVKLDSGVRGKLRATGYSYQSESIAQDWINGALVYQKSFAAVLKKGCGMYNDRNVCLCSLAGISDYVDDITVIDGYCAATQNFHVGANDTIYMDDYATVFQYNQSIDHIDWSNTSGFDNTKDILFIGKIKYIKTRQFPATDIINR